MIKVFLWQAILLVLCIQSNSAWGQFIVGHRGASYDAPENTLASFNLAWEREADAVEGDFYLSSDGHVVCIHDKDTERVSGVKYVVAETTLEKLRTLDVGAWKGEKWRGERIPTLEEVIETVPVGKKLVIEIKVGPEIVDPILAILANSSLKPEQIIFISFHANTIETIENRVPFMRTHWLTSYKKNEKTNQWNPTSESVATTVRRIGTDGLGSKALPKVVDEAFLNEFRKTGASEFHVWTVDDPAIARKYRAWGAWAITTNRPGWLKKELQTD